MFPGLDLYYTDPAQPLTTTHELLDDLDDVDDLLIDYVSELWNRSFCKIDEYTQRSFFLTILLIGRFTLCGHET